MIFGFQTPLITQYNNNNNIFLLLLLLLLPSHISFFATETDSFILRRSTRIPHDNHVLLSLLCYELNMLYIHTCYITPHIHHTPLKFLFHFYFFFLLLFFAYSFISLLLEAKRLLKCVETKFPFLLLFVLFNKYGCICCAYDSLVEKLNEFGMVVLGGKCMW